MVSDKNPSPRRGRSPDKLGRVARAAILVNNPIGERGSPIDTRVIVVLSPGREALFVEFGLCVLEIPLGVEERVDEVLQDGITESLLALLKPLRRSVDLRILAPTGNQQ